MKHKTLYILALAGLVVSLGSCGGPGDVASADSAPVGETSSTDNTESPTSSATVPTTHDPIYAAPAATNNPDGSQSNPYSIYQAIREVLPGQTLYLLDGEYRLSSTVAINNSQNPYPATQESERKTMKPLNYGQVKFNFSAMPFASSNRGVSVDADYWTVYGLEVFGAGDNGINIGGHYNIIENCITHDNSDSGIQLGRASSSFNSIEDWPSYNLIKNCTSYDNHDPTGEDSDGFACKLTTGVGNVFDGCIAYNNVDDGWDLYTKGDTGAIGPVTLKNCIAFNNGVTTKGVGTANSDGNGFKLGGESIPVNHIVENCIAFNNLANGFTDNSNPGVISLTNCTSFNNGVRDNDVSNFQVARDTDTSFNTFKGLLSFSTAGIDFRTNTMKNFNSKDEFQGNVEECVFYYGKTFFMFDEIDYGSYANEQTRGTITTPSASPFVSLTIPNRTDNIHELWRDENYNVAIGDFLKVNPTFVTEVFERTVSLGADLSGGSK